MSCANSRKEAVPTARYFDNLFFLLQTAWRGPLHAGNRGTLTPHHSAYSRETKSGPNTSTVVDNSLITTCSAGPAVSLNGSPTVSPVTAALWASLPLPPKFPSSTYLLKATYHQYIAYRKMNSHNNLTYFFALSHAPPTLSRNRAIIMPVTVPNMRYPARTSAPSSGLP